ncbi:MAG TPA: hypothetical protein PKN62_00390 [bacterium]|nr:hypothetical protein [bacterium]
MKKIFTRASQLLAIFLPLALFLLPIIAAAQGDDPLGVNYMEGTGLSKQDPRIMVARFIQIGLGFLGTIAVVLVIYAGFIWMTSEGNAEKIKKAKDLLKSAAIGLLIILSSFAIVTFVINKLNEAIGGSSGQQSSRGDNNQNGLAAIGSGIVQSVYPEPWQNDVPRNTSIIVTFREKVKASTICENGNDSTGVCNNANIVSSSVKFFQTETGDNVATNLAADKVKVSSNDGKIFVFTPTEYLGSASNNVWQSVKLTTSVRKANGSAAFTLGDFTWQFEVSTKVDLTPPQVQLGGIIPVPDNDADLRQGVRQAVRATSYINFNGSIQVAATATTTAPQPSTGSGAARLQGKYNCDNNGTVTVTVRAGTPLTAEVGGIPGVINDEDVSDNQINLGCGLSLLKSGNLPPDNRGQLQAGNSWTFNVTAERLGSSLTIGNQTYHFVAASTGQQNDIVASSPISEIISYINSTNDQVEAVLESASTIKLLARQAGEIGNSLTLLTDSSALSLTQFSGGSDRQEQIEVKGAPDIPRNSVIQINFSEAINPMTVVGNSAQVSSTIRVLNASTSEPIAGKFTIGNQYKTLEFVSDDKCGTNACGDDIYCLPANTRVIVEIKAAVLNPCNGDEQCVDKTPYSHCSGGFCQKEADDRYPIAALPLTAGLVDTCFNSLDGNRDIKTAGPVDFYDENAKDNSKKDSYKWSFFVNDNIDLTPPKITNSSLLPAVNQSGSSLNQLIEFSFDKIMMATTLGSGSVNINNHQHQLVNLYSAGSAPSFWVTSQAIDSGVPDGYPDYTKIKVLHGLLSEATRYSMEVGSGVKDSRQNCFKPCRDDAACNLAESSCCGGQPQAAASCQ